MQPRFSSEAGQAAVESALTLPLTVFLILGTIQLFLMMQGRAIAQYAVARATRAGSLHHGACEPMRHTALAAVMPALARTRSADELVDAFTARREGRFRPALDSGHTETILWLRRSLSQWRQDEEELFDQASRAPQTLTVELVFWFPLKIPFADWVINAIALGTFGLRNPPGPNPLMPTDGSVDWMESLPIDSRIGAELQARSAARHYVMPIVVSSSMRMMTPARRDNFRPRTCAPYP